MSSIIISRIILAAFLSISLSACSKDSKSSKATVRKGGQSTAQKTKEELEAEAIKKEATDKSAETPVENGTTPTAKGTSEDTDGDENDSTTDDSAEVTGTSTITVTPIAPVIKAPAAQAPKPAPAPVKTSATVKAQTPVAKQAAAPVKATPAVPAVVKSAPVPVKAAPAPVKAAAPKTTTTKVAPTKVAAPTAVPAAKVLSAADKSAEAKRLADEKAKARAARQAARKEILIKNEEDLDKDDSSKENLGSAAYKAIVDKLLAGIDMKNSVEAFWAIDSTYFSSDEKAGTVVSLNKLIPYSLALILSQSKVCEKGCLLIEVTAQDKVIASYISSEIRYLEAAKKNENFIDRKEIKPDAALQADIEKLSRISGGKTVVFTKVKNAAEAAALLEPAASEPTTTK